MADSVFLGNQGVSVAAAGAISGDGQIGDPLQVVVDGTTIEINGSNELALVTGAGQERIPSAATSTITLGAVVGTTQAATIQLKNLGGDNIAVITRVPLLYFTNSATGVTLAGAEDLSSITATTGNLNNFAAPDAQNTSTSFTSAAGVLAFTLDNAGAAGAFTQRIAIALIDGNVVSDAFNIPNA